MIHEPFIPSQAAADRVAVRRHGRVLVITMTRPEKRNAIDQAMTQGLDSALNEMEDDPDLWCGVLAGDLTAFSAGTDLAEGTGRPTQRGGEYGLFRRGRRKPLIAAIEGSAFGDGFELVLSCDVIVAGTNASFCLPEVARGVIPTCEGLFRGWRTLPLNVVKEMVLTGLPLPADRASDLGLVNRLVPDGGTLEAALELADQICANSPVAVTACLDAMDELLIMEEDDAWAATAAALSTVLDYDDHREGIAAFLERRPPSWPGR